MLSIHDDALATVDENLHTFLLRYKADCTIVYGFVEGKQDPMFYRNAIESLIPEGWTVDLIKSGNKSRVIRTFHSSDWSRYGEGRVAFFVDADLDGVFRPDFTPNAPNFYVTDGYSIENDIVNSRVFIRLSDEIMGISNLSEEEERNIIGIFEHNLREFQSALAPIMALIICWRERQVNAHLDNLNLAGIFTFEHGRLLLNQGMESADARLSAAAQSVGAELVSEEARTNAEQALDANGGASRLTRGKYLTWLLAKTLKSVHESIEHITMGRVTCPKVKAEVGPASVMIHAAPRTRCPVSLKEFVIKNYVSYIAASAASARCVTQ